MKSREWAGQEAYKGRVRRIEYWAIEEVYVSYMFSIYTGEILMVFIEIFHKE